MTRPRIVQPGEAERFEALLPTLPGAGREWLERLRRAGMRAYAGSGLPSQKAEAWKYTSLNALRKLSLDSFAEPGGGTVDRAPRLLPEDAAGGLMVFVDGLFRPELSSLDGLPEGVSLAPLAACLDDEEVADRLGRLAGVEDSPLVALNAALLRDGYVLRLAEGAEAARPIEIVHLSLPGGRPTAAHGRNLIVAGAGAKASLFEHHLALGPGVYAVNAVTEAWLGRGAELRLYKAQAEGEAAYHLHRTAVEVAEAARYESFVLTLGAALSRQETQATLAGPRAAARVDGAYALQGSQHADTLTAVDHAAVETLSRQVYKGVLDGASRAAVQGKVLVRPGARGSDGQQLNKTLLLSRQAEIDSKPELEIHVDDVKCSHGATAGELDDDAIFYLRSRGLAEAEARRLLVQAFLDEAVAEAADAGVAEALRGLLHGWLAGGARRAAA